MLHLVILYCYIEHYIWLQVSAYQSYVRNLPEQKLKINKMHNIYTSLYIGNVTLLVYNNFIRAMIIQL